MLKKTTGSIRHILESIMVREPQGKNASFLWFLLVIGVLGCSALMFASKDAVALDAFFLPILLAFFFFRRKGIYIIIPAFVIFHVTSYCILEGDLSYTLTLDILELFKWLVVACFSLVTLERFAQSKNHEMRIERDIGMARTLQTALVPKNYDVGRVRIEGVMRQCQEIGGDFYYFRPFQSKYVVFCLGDVMGKGIPASMVMAIVMSFFYEWGKKSPSPALVLSKLNKRLLELWKEDTTWFTTLFYGVLDEETGTLAFASGGHDSALLLRRQGEISRLRGEGMPVGAFPEASWDERHIQLNEGDRVILFTDGLTETRAQDGSLFSLERVIQVVDSKPVTSSQELISRLDNAAQSFSGGLHSDDMAILVLELKEGALLKTSSQDIK